MGLIELKTNRKIEEEKQKEEENLLEVENPEEITPSLAGYLRKAWEEAKRDRIDTENQILINMRQIVGIYDPTKIAEIRKFGGSETYLNYTQTKWRNAHAWISDVLSDIPFDIDPTPKPTLPKNMEDMIVNDFVEKTVEEMLFAFAQQGMPIDSEMIARRIENAFPEIKEGAEKEIKEYAKEKAKDMKLEIHDQLVEGGWYDAIEKITPDIFMKVGILKGPVIRMEKQRKVSVNERGIPKITYEEVKVPQYERRPPLDIYPFPGVTSFQKGGFVDRLRYTPVDIQNFIGLPGFNEKEVRQVLEECRTPGTKLREWTMIDVDRAEAEKKNPTMIWDWEEVDCLEFHCPVQGRILHTYSDELKKKAPDEDIFYDIEAYLIQNHVIKAVLNPDPLRRRNYSKCSFINLPDSFWGLGIPEVIHDIQGAINACIRALSNNVGIASGPQVTIDESVLSDFESGDMTPWKRWWVKYQEGVPRGTIKAIEFYQPTLIAQQLIETIKFLMALGDEFTIPAWTHGNPQAGGAGTTASGFSMFQTASSRGIKLVLKQMDKYIIEESIQRQFDWNMNKKKFSGLIGDMKIVPKGLRSLIAKEQQATRQTELYNVAAASKVLTAEEMRNFLRLISRTHEIDPDDFMEGDLAKEIMKSLPGPTGVSLPKGANINEAGDRVQGKDFQTIYGRGGPPEAPPIQ